MKPPFWIIPYFCPPGMACPYLSAKVFSLYGVSEKKYPLPKETASVPKYHSPVDSLWRNPVF
jgi:hypothetical protein